MPTAEEIAATTSETKIKNVPTRLKIDGTFTVPGQAREDVTRMPGCPDCVLGTAGVVRFATQI